MESGQFTENKETSVAVPPELVFHYTTYAGLLGIISEKAVWASDVRYLNDSKEHKFAAELACDEIAAIRESSLPGDRYYLDEIAEYLKTDPSDAFVCSFSEQGDLLSQWRGYAPFGRGLCIGFDSSLLTKQAKKLGSNLLRCVYDSQEQRVIIRDLLRKTVTVCQSYRAGHGGDRLGIGTITLNYFFGGSSVEFSGFSTPASDGFNKIAPLIKHPSYSEEKEWRIVWGRGPLHKGFSTTPIHFRQGNNTLVPYTMFEIGDLTLEPIIRKIIVGPTSLPDLSRQSIQDLVTYEGINGCSVLNSAIPYRG